MPRITIELNQDILDALAAQKDETAPSVEEVAGRILYQLAYQRDDKIGYRTPCTCGNLDRLADDPQQPIHFDTRTNEYWITYDPARRNLIIRYCFICGGAAPVSKRASLFVHVPATEKSRLAKLCEGITTFEEAINRLGPPDIDTAGGMMMPAKNEGVPEKTIVLRTITYRHLSDTVDLFFIEKPNSDGVSLLLSPKPAEEPGIELKA